MFRQAFIILSLCCLCHVHLQASEPERRLFVITSTVEGAHVYIDGNEAGSTPFKTALTLDSHWFYGEHDGIESSVVRMKVKKGHPTQVDTIRLIFHEYVDLGLPSGTLWATCNVGAEVPEEAGYYFAWGETKPVDKHTSENYTYQTLMTRKDDAAVKYWGASWCMPTRQQQEEIINKHFTVCEWTKCNGVNGYKVTSLKNGNSIFLPAAGYSYDGVLKDEGAVGNYWSGTRGGVYLNGAYQWFFYVEDTDTHLCDRYYGRNIRPVVRR